MRVYHLIPCFFIVALKLAYSKDTYSQINESLFSNIQCVPYAYGDFNADKRVDIFCVSNQERQIEIWLAQEKEPLFTKHINFTLKSNSRIVNLVPGDFNGDSVMDILVVYEDNNLKMSLFLGEKKTKYSIKLKDEKEYKLQIIDQPFVSDFNGDGKLDLLLTIKQNDSTNSEFYTFDLFGEIEKLTSLEFDQSIDLHQGYANSIVDVNNDFKPDLVLTTKKDNKIEFKIFINNQENNQYEAFESYKVPDSSLTYGQSLFADFDSDGNFEHLLPACKDDQCSKSIIFIKKNDKWNEIPIDFGQYGFAAPKESNKLWGNSISVKTGDYNLNGYLDLMLVLEDRNFSSSKKVDKYAILMKNVPSDVNNSSATFNRTFKIDQHIMSLFSFSNVVQASFFDLYDDGYLDILLVLKEDDSGNYKLVALKNEYYDDVYFIKVMVIPGNCLASKCPCESLPYGLNNPGALIKIETTSFEYQRVVLYASQLSQSAYMSLQLPYTIFGLGSTPNFVEHLTVGILGINVNQIRGYSKEWHQIIPNSQLVISPYPRHYPYYWKMQLFITPSKNILMTGISLGSTMICLIIVIGFLQYREKKLDEKERKLESQRFHFDGL